MTNPITITIGISACLLGEPVRYDGDHKQDRFITETMGRLFRLLSVCPEVGCGLTTPREAMRLEGDPAAPRLVTCLTRIDLTEQMLAYCRAKVVELEREDLCGFIFKKNSPSSGLSGVKIFNNGITTNTASGLFASAVVGHFPLLPVVEDELLADAGIRADFIDRVRSYRSRKK